VKLLLDQNLSHRLCATLRQEAFSCVHVRDLGLERADDETIWNFARQEGYVIVSKDEDFHQRSFLHGHPPKVVWLRVGNCSTDDIAKVIRLHLADLVAFDTDPETALLVLS
jgi:predicted nuclease of predicted toxin-antitoxin system